MCAAQAQLQLLGVKEDGEEETVTQEVDLSTEGCMLSFIKDYESDGDLGSTDDQVTDFCAAVAQQLEPLLLLAYTLRLEALQRRLAGCIAAWCSDRNGILYGRLESVFTDRVLGAALPPTATEGDEMAFIEQVLAGLFVPALLSLWCVCAAARAGRQPLVQLLPACLFPVCRADSCLPCDVLQPGSSCSHSNQGCPFKACCIHSKSDHRCCLPVVGADLQVRFCGTRWHQAAAAPDQAPARWRAEVWRGPHSELHGH